MLSDECLLIVSLQSTIDYSHAHMINGSFTIAIFSIYCDINFRQTFEISQKGKCELGATTSPTTGLN